MMTFLTILAVYLIIGCLVLVWQESRFDLPAVVDECIRQDHNQSSRGFLILSARLMIISIWPVIVYVTLFEKR